MAEFRQATRPAGKKGEVVLTPWASALSSPRLIPGFYLRACKEEGAWLLNPQGTPDLFYGPKNMNWPMKQIQGFPWTVPSQQRQSTGGKKTQKKYIMVVWYIWSSNPRITNPIKVLRAELVGWPKNDESFTF